MTTSLCTRSRASRARRGVVLLVVVAAASLAACGSRVAPATIAGSSGSGVAGVAPGTDGGLDGATPGSGTGPASAGAGGSDGGPGSTSAGGTGTGTAPGAAPGAGGGGEAPGAGAQGEGENAADGGVKAGSCDGFENQVGITDDTITVANVSDISGPVPGIFESAQQATRAYAAYVNATGDICGRSLKVLDLDSRSDAGADQQAYARACEQAFAAVGSMSAFDSGGARTAEECGLPDIRSYSVNGDRTACTTCFAAYAVQPDLVPNAMPQYWAKKAPEAVKSVAMFYVNAGAAPANAASFRAAWEKNGWDVKVFEAIDTAEFNYAPYVQQAKDAGARLVNYTGPYQFTVRLQQAMKQQGFEPEIFLQDATVQDQRYVDEAGADGEGTYVYSQTPLFDDYSVAEMKLYRSWLQQVDPGAQPNTYGVFAWSAARLFVEQAIALGGRLTRDALVQRMARVEDWTGNGIHVPQQVGAETTADCASIIQLRNGTWKKVSPGEYLCGSMTNTGLGG
ncbi:ABC transporter substrate-binding protein [Nocardioides marmotae]|uniref:ABC transporter substrate-binding protein n=1 Tax=Nocardioides marmotae TaxID=2663857 RepID=A0A6I3JCQ2_9ACTN|nr:ABC transporter substrate-binding protein [Nocardioides marmotae]MCR6032250.1 ABC transporter substrate-binding protein [Gordonia jinghuaiqii]MBC9734825.1 ABC transporter substrate-binding protein [Nocardioides marmotae]MTB85926.1 ABC transporter substrate-binding protein [Nocardioides marmotae]MTB95898.1 ABC transporter substrate-binding protein [Nocardioides marmotae]QKE02758.1 ABC transporter substrate-binding protein [Nocardioides marmotae]